MNTKIDKRWMIEFVNRAGNHEQWLMVVEFGKSRLLDQQDLLIELIIREADRLIKLNSHHKTSDKVSTILKELGLSFSCNDMPPGNE